MSVHLDTPSADAICAQGEKSYPHECCGFLIGHLVNRSRRVVRVQPVANAREDEARHNRYLIAPDTFMRTERQARKDGLDVVGFYHSHPDAPARPSAFDTEQAWPWYVYLIVSIQQGRSEIMTAWELQDDRSQFNEVSVTIED